MILDAAALAEFEVVDLVEEAVAAAAAFVRLGRRAGRSVLVYNLGGGMFDLAVVRQEDGPFQVAVEPDGDDHCGGDDFDQALYDYFDGITRERFGRPINTAGGIDPIFLRQCCFSKEKLSSSKRSRFTTLLSSEEGWIRSGYEIDLKTFEGLIREQVENTVRKTASMTERAKERGHGVDTVVLIGGSSRVPLVERRLKETLEVEPRKFANKDYAVALGAAYYAGGALELPAQGLSKGEAARIEREVMGATVEEALASPHRESVTSSQLEGFTLARTLVGHSDGVLCVTISPNGRFLLSGSKDQTVMFWDLRTEEPLRIIFYEGWINSVAFSPDGKVFAGAGSSGRIQLWDTRTGEPLHTLAGHASPVFSIAFGSDGKVLASGSKDKTIKLWHPRTGEELLTVTGHENEVLSLALSPDGTLISSGSKDRTVKLWDSGIGELLRTLPRYTDRVYSVAFSADGSLLAAGRRDEEIELWDVQIGAPLRTLKGYASQVYSIAFSPDGQIIAGGGEDQKIELWDVKTGEPLRALTGHTGDVRSVVFGSDGRTIASGSSDNTIKIWGKVR